MKEQHILPEDLFRDGFKNHEETFDPAAWEQMEKLLDKEDDLKPILLVTDDKGKKIKRLIFLILGIMSILSILTIFSTLMVNNNNHTNHNSGTIDKSSSAVVVEKVPDSKQHETVVEHPAKGSKTVTKTDVKSVKTVKSKQVSTGSGLSKQEASPVKTESGSTESNKTTESTVNETPLDTFKTVINNNKVYKVLVRKTWIPEEYEWVEDVSDRTISDAFIGFHFTAQKPRATDTMSAGFNFQIMSGNRLNNKHWGLYGGFDWGMQFYGKSKKTNVALNNTRQDSGFSVLRSRSMDFLGRAHLEYSKFAIVPYLNAMAGPRLYYANQHVASYVPLENTESSTTNNAHTSVAMMYGWGAGLRFRVSPVVSLDLRYEWMNGTKVKQVDLNKSTFNGLNYDLKYKEGQPKLEQFKLGILINLSERNYDKKLVKEGYYKETIIDSLQVDPKDSNKVYLPCYCAPCDQTKNDQSYNNRDDEEYIPASNDDSNTNDGGLYKKGNGVRTNSSGTRSGGSKGAFPGIKTPAPTPKPTAK